MDHGVVARGSEGVVGLGFVGLGAVAEVPQRRTAGGIPESPEGEWLFDMREDPTEQVNLAKIRPEKVAELRGLLAAYNAEQAAPAWPSVAEMPINIDKSLAEPDAVVVGKNAEDFLEV